MLKFIRPSLNSVFDCNNCKGIKYLVRLRVGPSHLREHIFIHSFQDILNQFGSCDLDIETNMHFFLYCFLFSNQRCTLLSIVNDINSSLANTNDSILTHILPFGKPSLDISTNIFILNATVNFIISTNRQIWRESFLVFCIFRILMSFLRLRKHIHLVLRFAFIIYWIYYFTIYFCLDPGVVCIYKICISLALCSFVFLFTSHKSFVSIMESLQILISMIKCVLITPYRSSSNFL